MAKQDNVISQWCQLIENFQASSLEFYKSFEKAVEARAVPEIHSARVEHKEGGLASAKREYVRMHRGKHAFDDLAPRPSARGFSFPGGSPSRRCPMASSTPWDFSSGS